MHVKPKLIHVPLRAVLALALATILLVPHQLAIGQTETPDAAATPLALGHLSSVVDMPMFLRLYRAYLPAGKQIAYEGSNALLYDLSGAAAITSDGGALLPLDKGAGAFIPAGRIVTIRATASEPIDLLLFLLTALPNQRRPVLDRPAVVKELFRTGEALPGLQAGPYEFALKRLTFPAYTPARLAYFASGAALDYVLAGTATLTAEGKSETIPAKTPVFERLGWAHQLANPGVEPLVVLRASIRPGGAPGLHQAADR